MQTEINGMADLSRKFRTRELESVVESIQRGDFGKAEKILLQITAREPNDFSANHMLGVVSTELNKFEQAEKFFKTALSVNAKSAQVYKNYGFFLTKAKRFDKAIEQFNIALRLLPNFALAYSDRGNALEKLNKLDDAIADYNRAIALAPGVFGFYNNRGNAHLRKKQFSEALYDFKRAIELNPNFADAYCSSGNVLADLKRYEEALADYDKALSLKPDLESAWLGRGNVFAGLRRYEDALAAYDQALSLKFDLENAWLGRGNVFVSLNRYDEALAAFDKALALNPDLENAWLGRGNVFAGLKRYDDAFAAYDKALALEPACADAHYNEGLLRLSLGDMSGWVKCEYRWETQQFRAQKRNFSQPLWLGDADIKDKTILLHAEQGLGDTLFVCRYIPKVAALGAKVILEAQPPLKSLLRDVGGVSMAIGRSETIPHFDVHCPLMSLPLAFKTSVETIPGVVPYLTVPKHAVEKWRPKLSDAQELKVGIAWAGNPDFAGDRARSILLQNILAVTRVNGIKYFSLQKDLRHGDDEILNANPHIVRIDKDINDFEDTAAILMSLDLVISSDTAIVNLAGASGRPVWVLLPFASDWRWLIDRDDTPWYPTARLFRQAAVGDWTTLVDEVCAALEQSVAPAHVRAPA
jgi:tetratricopeptide (TPR) repeat protein